MAYVVLPPDNFNEATIFPLIKNKRKSVNDSSSNYRAIALSLDAIVLHNQ